MIIEQIRYFVDEPYRDQLVDVRREIARIREGLGVPGGHILIADPPPDDGPCLVWQCAYSDEGELGYVETKLVGHAGYEEARERVAPLVTRVELELYTIDGDEPSVANPEG